MRLTKRDKMTLEKIHARCKTGYCSSCAFKEISCILSGTPENWELEKLEPKRSEN